MKISWTWREALTFALSPKLGSHSASEVQRFSYKMNAAEKYSSLVLKHFYKVIGSVRKKIRQPVAIALFTLGAAILSLLVFYNFPVVLILGKMPYQAMRTLLFLYVEALLFCIGCCALGRFNNPTLIHLWKKKNNTL